MFTPGVAGVVSAASPCGELVASGGVTSLDAWNLLVATPATPLLVGFQEIAVTRPGRERVRGAAIASRAVPS